MIFNKNSIAVSLLLFAMFFMSVLSFAESAQDIKERMMARIPEINQLKTSGIIGEGNDGFLKFVGAVSEKETMVNAENEDRKKVYSAIAKQQGATPEIVGHRRALQIADKADSGDWLQDLKGAWYQK